MNKQALKLKKKRQELRKLEKLKNQEKIWNEFNSYRQHHNLPLLEKNEKNLKFINNYTNNIDSKILERSGILILLCSIYTLCYKYNYNSNDIMKYANKIKYFIESIANNKRSIEDIVFEITNDYEIDVFSKCKKFSEMSLKDFKLNNLHKHIDKLTGGYFPYFLCISAYAFMCIETKRIEISWNTQYIDEFINANMILYEQIFNNSNFINELHEELVNKSNIAINLTSGDVIKLNK